MADSEKEYILEKLQEALEKAENDGCIYAKIRRPIVFDTIALLKRQEAVKPKKAKGYYPPMYTLYEYECEKCETPMLNQQPFCMGCGRKVEWNDI